MPTLPQTSRDKSQEALANIRTSKNPNPAKKLCYTRMCFFIRYKSCHDRMPQSACYMCEKFCDIELLLFFPLKELAEELIFHARWRRHVTPGCNEQACHLSVQHPGTLWAVALAAVSNSCEMSAWLWQDLLDQPEVPLSPPHHHMCAAWIWIQGHTGSISTTTQMGTITDGKQMRPVYSCCISTHNSMHADKIPPTVPAWTSWLCEWK